MLMSARRGRLCADRRPDHPPVPQHRDAVGDGVDLVEAMRDVDHRHVMVAQAADDVEEVLDLAVAQRRGGLVHDEDAGVEAERLGDLDELALADAQALDGPARVDVEAEAWT